MALYKLMWDFILTTACYLNVYVCTEMKITSSFKQTVCFGGGVHFFNVDLLVLTISSDDVLRYDVCAPEFVNHSYLI